MDDADLALRNTTYRLFVEAGRTPSVDEVAAAAGVGRDEAQAGWLRLAAEHALVLTAGGDALRMANPFSAVPTPYRVRAAGRDWFGNCAWDAFGICAALHTGGRIETACPDCGAGIGLDVQDGRPSEESLLFHCLVPAARWWDDIGFT